MDTAKKPSYSLSLTPPLCSKEEVLTSHCYVISNTVLGQNYAETMAFSPIFADTLIKGSGSQKYVE